MNNYNYDFITKNPESEEKRHCDAVIKMINVYQTNLINYLIQRNIEGFLDDDIQNLYPNNVLKIDELQGKIDQLKLDGIDDEIDELEKEIISLEDESPAEIYCWISISLFESDYEKLDKANWAYIRNEFGTWIARYDFGSAQDLYFIPQLAAVLFGNDNE